MTGALSVATLDLLGKLEMEKCSITSVFWVQNVRQNSIVAPRRIRDIYFTIIIFFHFMTDNISFYKAKARLYGWLTS